MKIIKNQSLSLLTNFRIGGIASYFVEIENHQDLEEFYNWEKKENLPIFILGGGTNILANNFSGVVLKPKFNYLEKIEEGILKVGSNVLVKDLLDYTIQIGYQGLEWAGGLPGTVGGAVEGGVGCFGGEFKNLVLDVTAIDLKNFEYRVFSKEDCQFKYRNSFFRQNKNWLIIEARLNFIPNANSEELKKIAEEKINYRKEKHPMEYPSAGSVFQNIPFNEAPKFVQDLALEKNKVKNDPFLIIPVAFLISEAGLQGKRIGDAQISEKHSNFIINLGRATFNDVWQLIDLVKKTLEDKFEVQPKLEIQILDDSVFH